MRLTPRRKKILEIIKNNDHLDAYQILELARAEDRDISLSTVYRAIAAFKQAGLVEEKRFGETHAHYEYVGDRKGYHTHLICKKCAKVYEVKGHDYTDITRLAGDRGFEPETIHIDIYGICSDCKK